jgi:hypothetical protein
VLGVPASPGAVGWLLIALGVLVIAVGVGRARGVLATADRSSAAAVVALLVAIGSAPYIVWRIVEDLRYTTALGTYDATFAGPVQAYLPGYLLDGATRLIPPGSTYATVVSPTVPWAPARTGFGPLAMNVLFPRRGVADPRVAAFVVSWGVAPRRVTSPKRIWVLRKASGAAPAILVAQVKH